MMKQASILVLVVSLFACPVLAQTWEFSRPYPHGNTYLDIESDGAGKVYLVGDAGTVTVFDGNTLQQIETPTEKSLHGISILAPDDIWVCGGDEYSEDPADQPVILHYNGSEWSEHPGPDGNRICNDIYAAAADNVWVCVPLSQAFWHWDGSDWSWDYVLPTEVEGSLDRFHGFGPDNIYVAGTHGQILHYDGSSWTLEQKLEEGNFTVNLIQDIWGSDPDNVYACEGYGRVHKRNANGTWSLLHQGDIDEQFTCIWATAEGTLYAAGSTGLHRYQGGDFVKIETGLSMADFSVENMEAAPDGRGAILTGYKGGIWRLLDNAVIPLTVKGGSLDSYDTVNGVPFNDSFVLMGPSGVHGWSNYTYLWLTDGNNFIPFGQQPTASENVNRVKFFAGSPETNIWLVLERIPYYDNASYYWDGSTWQMVIWYNQIDALYPLGNEDAFFFNTGGMFLFEDNTTTPVDTSVTDVQAVFGRSRNELFMVGTAGAAYYYNGSTVVTQDTGVENDLTAIAGDSDEVYAVGVNRTAIYRKSGGWKQVEGLTTRDMNDFKSLVYAGDNTFYACLQTPEMYIGGDRGEIYKFQNGEVVDVRRGLTLDIAGTGVTGSGKVLGWGERGLLMELSDTSPVEYAGIVNPTSQPQQVLGETGITVEFAGSNNDEQLLRARAYDSLPAGQGLEDIPTSQQYWSIASSANNVTATVSIQYDPELLPQNADIALACLFRNDGEGWTAVNSEVWNESQMIRSVQPTGFSLWTIGFSPTSADFDLDQDVDEVDLITLLTAMKGLGEVKDLSGDGAMSADDLFLFSASWSPNN